jgi:hypothetical protein
MRYRKDGDLFMDELKSQSKQASRNDFNRSRVFRVVLFIAIISGIAFNSISKNKIGYADAYSQVSVSINYLEELAYITPGTGTSTRYYFSTDNKVWEMIDTNGVLDLSSLLSSKPVTVYFKGNKDTYPVTVILQGEEENLDAAFKITAGVGRIEFNTGVAVEYRKGANGAWKTAVSPIYTTAYEVKGTTLYFRTPATALKRAGKIVSVKIPKKPTGPSAKLDGSRLYITGMKDGLTQYRLSNAEGWTTFTAPDTKNKTLSLYYLLSNNIISNNPIPAGMIEFRMLGTDKKLTSAVKVIEIPQQPVIIPTMVNLTGTTLKILESDTKIYYEYTVVEQNHTLDLNTAKWTAVTSKKDVIVPKVSINDKVLIRKKSYTDKETKKVIPASTYVEYTVKSITMTN